MDIDLSRIRRCRCYSCSLGENLNSAQFTSIFSMTRPRWTLSSRWCELRSNLFVEQAGNYEFKPRTLAVSALRSAHALFGATSAQATAQRTA